VTVVLKRLTVLVNVLWGSEWCGKHIPWGVTPQIFVCAGDRPQEVGACICLPNIVPRTKPIETFCLAGDLCLLANNYYIVVSAATLSR